MSHLAEDASDVDDASPALFEHGANDLLDAEISGSEVRLQHGVPVGAFHPHDELVAGDAGIVDQDVDLAELGDGRLDRGFNLLFVADIEGEGGCFAVCGGDLIHQLIQLVLIARGHCDRGACRGELDCAGAADALRCSGNQCHSS